MSSLLVEVSTEAEIFSLDMNETKRFSISCCDVFNYDNDEEYFSDGYIEIKIEPNEYFTHFVTGNEAKVFSEWVLSQLESHREILHKKVSEQFGFHMGRVFIHMKLYRATLVEDGKETLIYSSNAYDVIKKQEKLNKLYEECESIQKKVMSEKKELEEIARQFNDYNNLKRLATTRVINEENMKRVEENIKDIEECIAYNIDWLLCEGVTPVSS